MDTNWLPDLAEAGRSKYKALANAIRDGVATGALESGQKLLPVRELAYQLSVTPGTVARAYSLLTEEGVLSAGVGRGTFVAEGGAQSDPSHDWPQMLSLRSPLLPDMGQSEMIRDAMQKTAEQINSRDLLSYPSRAMDLPLRRAMRRWMSDLPIGAFTAEELVLTHGAQHALILVMQTVLKGPEPVVAVEDLTYTGFRRAAALCRARVVAVDTDEEGPVVEHLERLVREEGVQLFCTSSEVNNPTVRFTSDRRRREIAKMARRLDLHIVDDDCYAIGTHRAESYYTLLPDRGWYISSLSKALTPALRVGYVVAPKAFVPDLERTAHFNSFGLAPPLSDLAYRFLEDPRLRSVAAKVRVRINELVRTAVNHLGGHDVSWNEDVPLLWLKLPYGWRTSSFVHAAESRGVLVRSAEDFILRDGRAPHAVRIGVNGMVDPARFEDGIVRLAELLDNPREEIGV